jgi:Pentapeptide repeats (8 copies)/NACHT domain
MVKLKELLPKWFSKESTELVKTGAESTKAIFELGKAIKENKSTLTELQPYLKEISSLLDILNSPWAQVLKEGIPFASLTMTLLSLGCEQLKQDPSLEECVVLVTQAAYLASWQAELDRNPDLLKDKDLTKESKQIDRNFKKLADFEIDRAVATQLITALPASDLVKQFNQILVDRLVESGVDSAVASRFADRVAWNSPRYVNEIVAKLADKIEVLAEVYRNGGKEVLNHYASIDEYLRDRIQPLPSEQVFDEKDLQLQEIYVPLEIQPLATSGEDTSASPKPIELWAMEKLLDPKSQAILFIQGEAGRGKSVFCRMFADLVRRELAFTPILIRLREILTLGDTLTETLQQHLENFDFSKDKSWLTNKNQRFLFLLDGFDELILQGRSTGGLKEFIEQVEKFQNTSHHRILITGRPLAMQGIEKSAFRNKCLERVKLLPMSNEIRNDWLIKWAVKFGEFKLEAFVKFLAACPADVEDKLAREPLLLYVLARINREGAINAADLIGTSGMAAKVKVYDKAIEWVLEKQRDDLNQKIFNFKLEIYELRQLLTEVAVCVVQSGNEISKVNAIEYRLTKDPNNNLKELFDKICGTAINEEKALNNLLTTFYIQPAQGDRDGAVEFAHKSFGEFLFAERIKEAICDWSSVTTNRKREEDQIKQNDLEWQIYDLLGSGCLTPDIVDYLREMLSNSTEWQPLRLFDRLNQFWEEWCEGEFIDRTEDNLPQKKMKILKEQMPEREIKLGIRQVDVYTGLNILIILLELHRYAQGKDDLKNLIVFYPSGESQSSGHKSRLLKIIHNSDSIEINTFNQNLRFFISGANLNGANLSSTNLSGTDLSGANLSGTDLSGANLSRANLGGANLSSANLGGANLGGANLGGANLGGANLSRANLSGANLSRANLFRANLSVANLGGANLGGANLCRTALINADLSDANLSGVTLLDANLNGARLNKITWGKFATWRDVRGLENAIGIPIELKRHLRLR